MNYEQRASGCSGKQALASKALAESILQRGGSRTTYRCASCHLWHLGSTVRRPASTHSRQHRLLELREAEASFESFV